MNIIRLVQSKLFASGSDSKDIAKVFGLEEEYRTQQILNRQVNIRSTIPKGKYRVNDAYVVVIPEEEELPVGYIPSSSNTTYIVNNNPIIIQQQILVLPSSQPSVIESINEEIHPKIEYQAVTLSNENKQVVCDPNLCFECYWKQNSQVKAQQVCLTCMTQLCDTDAHMHRMYNPSHVLINKESALTERWDQLQVAYYKWEEENHLKQDELLAVMDRITNTHTKEEKEISIEFFHDCKKTLESTFFGRKNNLFNLRKEQEKYIVELKKKVDEILILLQDNNPTKIQENCLKFEHLLGELEAFLKYKPLLSIMQIRNDLPSLTELKKVMKCLVYDNCVLKL